MLGNVQELFRGFAEAWSARRLVGRNRPSIEALPLCRSEPSVRSLPLTMDAPRTLALRRIHLVNHGVGTSLRDWEVWTAAPGQVGMSRARLMSQEEWALISRNLVCEDDVPVLCRGDVLNAPTNRRIKRDLPFLVEGLLPDEVRPGRVVVYVLFRDRTNKAWHYGDGFD